MKDTVCGIISPCAGCKLADYSINTGKGTGPWQNARSVEKRQLSVITGAFLYAPPTARFGPTCST